MSQTLPHAFAETRENVSHEEAMMLHKRILQWQAEHPTITWILWGIVWLLVIALPFKPGKLSGMV